MPLHSRAAGRAILLLAPAAVLALVFAPVRPTNFGGHDEWLVISLATRGLIGFPYAHRPLALLWTAPGAALTPDDVLGYLIVHLVYLAVTGALVAWMAHRWLRLPRAVALLAGVFASTWAPRDDVRLDAVLSNRYSGATMGTLVASFLFVAGWRRCRRGVTPSGAALAAAGVTVAVAMVQGLEATVTLLAGAPLFVWAAWPRDLREPGMRRRLLWWSTGWLAVVAVAAAPFALTLARPDEGYQYQSAIGLDAHPLRLGGRVLRQYGAHLLPLFSPAPSELLTPTVPLAVAAFLAGFLALGWRRHDRADLLRVRRVRLCRAAALGAALAGLGWLTMSLSPLVASPARAQMLSAPGIALLLASLLGLAGSWAPPRRSAMVLAIGGAWVVALAAGRTAALQRQWDRSGFWVGQRGTLVQLTREAPMLKPNTLVLLVDEAGAWRASFSFRHALHYLYDPSVVGHVWNGHPFLYPVRFDDRGVRFDPWPSIRRAWQSAPTQHRHDEVLAARLGRDGRLTLLDEWPAELPPLPAGTVYAPRERIVAAPPPASRRILQRER